MQLQQQQHLNNTYTYNCSYSKNNNNNNNNSTPATLTPLASETPCECQPKFTCFPAEIQGKRQPKFTRNMDVIVFTRPACSGNSDSIGWEDTEQKPADVYQIPQQNMILWPASPPLRPPASLGSSDSSGRRGPRLNTSQSLPDSWEKHDRARYRPPACLRDPRRMPAEV